MIPLAGLGVIALLPFGIGLGLILDPNMERHNMLGWIMALPLGAFLYSVGIIFTVCPCHNTSSFGHSGTKKCLVSMYEDGDPIPWSMFLKPAFWPIWLFGIALPTGLWFVVKHLSEAVWAFLRVPVVNHRRIQRAKYKNGPAPKEGAYR